MTARTETHLLAQKQQQTKDPLVGLAMENQCYSISFFLETRTLEQLERLLTVFPEDSRISVEIKDLKYRESIEPNLVYIVSDEELE